MNGKRLFDILAAGTGLLVLAPLFALIALLVRRDGGPAFYRQIRAGRFGHPFAMIKFRSMRERPVRGSGLTVGEDNRITPIGRILRKWKIDELPQLWNVLRGDMSLVGPRPELPEYVARYPEAFEELLRERPGITDLASVRFRRESELLAGATDPEAYYIDTILPHKLELNRRYAQEATLARDIGIIFLTLWTCWR